MVAFAFLFGMFLGIGFGVLVGYKKAMIDNEDNDANKMDRE